MSPTLFQEDVVSTQLPSLSCQHLILCSTISQAFFSPGSYGCLPLVFTSVPLVDSTLPSFTCGSFHPSSPHGNRHLYREDSHIPSEPIPCYCHDITSQPPPLQFMFPTSRRTPWDRKPSILFYSSLAPSQVPGIKWHLVNIYGMGLQ